MVEEFKRVMQILRDCEYLSPIKTEEIKVSKPELSWQDFETKLVELESLIYEFDAKKITPILDELSQYSYNSKDLEQELIPVYKKIEMSDFMSAYETVLKIKTAEVTKC